MSNIPIIILNFNRLSTTERLCDQLLLLGYSNLHILDMSSTYPELLEWYKTCPAKVQVVSNDGHKALWTKGYIKQFQEHPWIAVTDSDIELDLKTPKDFIQQMLDVAKTFRMDKVGLSIKISDISNEYLKKVVYPIEVKYWQQRVFHKLHIFNAPVDTTFCIVKSKSVFQYPALRIADWPIKHLDWYQDFDNLTEEQQYYYTHADETIATTKQHYKKYLATK